MKCKRRLEQCWPMESLPKVHSYQPSWKLLKTLDDASSSSRLPLFKCIEHRNKTKKGANCKSKPKDRLLRILIWRTTKCCLRFTIAKRSWNRDKDVVPMDSNKMVGFYQEWSIYFHFQLYMNRPCIFRRYRTFCQ